MRTSVKVHQFASDEPLGGLISVGEEFPCAVTAYSHWNGGGEVRIRQCGNVVFFFSSGPASPYHQQSIERWRDSTGPGREWITTPDGLVEVPQVVTPPSTDAPRIKR